MSTTTAVTSACETNVARDEQPVALTEKQRMLIEKSWKAVEQDIGLLKGGIMLFMRMFEICPMVLKMFKKFSDVPYDQLPENEDLQNHAFHVMQTVGLAVASLDDTEELVVVLRELGGSHGSYDLQQAHFDVVGQCLLWTLEQRLGKEFTPEMKTAWTTMYGIVSSEMKEGLQEYKELTGGIEN